MKNNVDDIRDDLVLMIAGERVETEIRNYALRFKGKWEEKPKYKGRILAVGISYRTKTKKHSCKVEVL